MPNKKAKKTSAKRRSKVSRKKVIRTPIQHQQLESESRQSAPSATPPKVASPVRWPIATKYEYMSSELRRIGIIAGVMFVIIIILTFVLG